LLYNQIYISQHHVLLTSYIIITFIITETVQPESQRTQTSTYMTSGDTSETLTTTQQTIIQQTTTDVANNTQTTSSQSLLTILTTESAITIVNSTETFSEKPNGTAGRRFNTNTV